MRGVLDVNGIEVRFMPAEDLHVNKDLVYVDKLDLLPLIEGLSMDPKTKALDPMNLLLVGPKGNGKSLLLAYIALVNKIPYISLDCSPDTRERHLRGGFVVKSGSTPFVLGALSNAIQVANECGSAMLVLEEINALTPQRQKDLNSITDFRKKVEIPEMSWRVELRPGATLFIAATMNPSVYGGTYELNEDLKSRFFEVEVPYPAQQDEIEIIKTLIGPVQPGIDDKGIAFLTQLAAETRQGVMGYALSTRDLFDIAKAVERIGWIDALFMASQKFSTEDRKVFVDRVRDISKLIIPFDLGERKRHRDAQA